MNKTQEHLILKDAVEAFGSEAQIDILIEEMAEVTQAIMKLRRKSNNENLDHLHEELADLGIVYDQMKYIFDEGRINAYREAKLHRLEQRLKEYKEKIK